jgi:hypothetical protein
MAAQKRLASVCHSIAHHAVSGVSFVHPHLRQALRAAGEKTVVVDLLRDDTCPPALRDNRNLATALRSLHARFLDILRSEGFSREDLQEAKLLFEFTPLHPDDHCSNGHAKLTAADGRTYLAAVDFMGNTLPPRADL